MPDCVAELLRRGGGSFCGQNTKGLTPKQISCQVPSANGTFVNGTCYAKPVVPLCSGNGNVQLNFGAPEYVGESCNHQPLKWE